MYSVAIYANGSLQLLEPLALEEGERVTVTVERVTEEPIVAQALDEEEEIAQELVRRKQFFDDLEAFQAQNPEKVVKKFSGTDHDKILYSDPHGPYLR